MAFILASCLLLLSPSVLGQSSPDGGVKHPPATALATDSVHELRQQLAAQHAINEQLRQRVKILEKQLAASYKGNAPPIGGLDASVVKPPVDTAVANTAIEEALINKGLVLLPTGSFRLTPSTTWYHSGSGDNRFDSFAYALSLEAGLPWGMSASLRVPYIQRDYSAGSNDGWGDMSVTLSKKLTQETATLPSLVMRLGYTHDNGQDAFDAVPIGKGFRSLNATLSAVKHIEPVAIYGHLSYSHAWGRTAYYWDGLEYRTGSIKPADIYGVGLGISLAVTPDISINAGLAFDYIGRDTILLLNGDSYKTAFATAGYINLGADFVLHKNLFLNLSAAAGVTDDADDFSLSIALPYRF
jgi:hypothetical protein